jgi:hypothetical protein
MANTYEAIAKTVLTTTQATITFSSIASTYTDLVVLFSARTNEVSAADSGFWIYPNNNSGTMSYLRLRAIGSSVSSDSNTSDSYWRNAVNGAGGTADTFASGELYIPNYANAAFKVGSWTIVREQNSATSNQMLAGAGLNRDTTAINTLNFISSGNSFVSGSSFYLYGIKNS